MLGSIGASAMVAGAAAAEPIASVASAETFARNFLRSFENLDMESFIACFAEDASVFFPLPEPPQRFDGRAAIREHFQVVFDAIRTDAKRGPPYHTLNPANLEAKMLGPAAALVTFQLENRQRIARRTLVLRFERDWRIAHLHASNVATGPAA